MTPLVPGFWVVSPSGLRVKTPVSELHSAFGLPPEGVLSRPAMSKVLAPTYFMGARNTPPYLPLL